MVGTGKVFNNGNGGAGTSYPHPDGVGPIKSGNSSLGSTAHNYNVCNFDDSPGVLNESPSTQKSYSWNKGDAGNAK